MCPFMGRQEAGIMPHGFFMVCSVTLSSRSCEIGAMLKDSVVVPKMTSHDE